MARCTCCEIEVAELVTAPRGDGSLQPVCRSCRELIVEGKGWDELYASTRTQRNEHTGRHASRARGASS